MSRHVHETVCVHVRCVCRYMYVYMNTPLPIYNPNWTLLHVPEPFKTHRMSALFELLPCSVVYLGFQQEGRFRSGPIR